MVAAWRRVDRVQLAKLLGTHPDTVTDFTRQGMPVILRGGRGRVSVYDAVECLDWWRERHGKNAKELAQTRALDAQAQLAQQTVQMRARTLLPAAEVEKAWGGVVLAVRTKLLAVPTTIADRVARTATLEGVAGVETVLDSAIRDVLRELADPDAVELQATA
jgi:phage terminase Nu1 subunit (DNA packaging protein)